jgi:hypothetical protein
MPTSDQRKDGQVTNTTVTSESGVQRNAWLILFVVALFLAASSAFLAVSGVDATEFEASTGTEWAAFSASNPGVADYMLRLLRLAGVVFLGLNALVALVVYSGFRQGEKWTWYALWMYPVTLALVAAVAFANNSTAIGSYYAALALIALVGLILPFRKFFPRQLIQPSFDA